MKKYITIPILLLFIIILTVSCQKSPNMTMDDTWFLMDDSAILLLCEAPVEDKAYIKSVSNLKGNGDELEKVISELKKQGNDVKVQNAVGVAYLRLRQFDKAEEVLLQALQNAATEDEKVCILTNLSETEAYEDNQEDQLKYAMSANEACVSNPLKKMAVESNLIRGQMSKDQYGAPYNVEIKHLLKEEKRLLGSNQLIGIQNYKLLAIGCFYDHHFESSVKYMQKALKLNDSTYKNLSIKGNLYDTLSFIYSHQPSKENYAEGLKYADQYIDTLESWQTLDHFDLMNAYEERANMYINMNDADSALRDFQVILNRTAKGQIMRGVSYYNMGYIYMYQGDTDKAIDVFSKAYLILKNDKTQKKAIENLKWVMRTIYDDVDNGNQEGTSNGNESMGMSFEEWFSMQEMAAKRQLMKDAEK